jgi:peroxiredoxin Q/BCP
MTDGPRRSQRIAAAKTDDSKVKKETIKPKAKTPVKEAKKTAKPKVEDHQLKSEGKADKKSPSKPEKKVSETEIKPDTKKMTGHIKVGDELPDITLLDHEGNEVNVKEIAKEKTVVIFSYPKASTPGCTRQACGFRDSYPNFQSKEVAVFGLSADSVKAQLNFHDKQKLQYQLLSDPEYKLIEPLGAKKTETGGVVRSHWIIKNGKFTTVALAISPEQSFTSALEDVQ